MGLGLGSNTFHSIYCVVNGRALCPDSRSPVLLQTWASSTAIPCPACTNGGGGPSSSHHAPLSHFRELNNLEIWWWYVGSLLSIWICSDTLLSNWDPIHLAPAIWNMVEGNTWQGLYKLQNVLSKITIHLLCCPLFGKWPKCWANC